MSATDSTVSTDSIVLITKIPPSKVLSIDKSFMESFPVGNPMDDSFLKEFKTFKDSFPKDFGDLSIRKQKDIWRTFDRMIIGTDISSIDQMEKLNNFIRAIIWTSNFSFARASTLKILIKKNYSLNQTVRDVFNYIDIIKLIQHFDKITINLAFLESLIKFIHDDYIKGIKGIMYPDIHMSYVLLIKWIFTFLSKKVMYPSADSIKMLRRILYIRRRTSTYIEYSKILDMYPKITPKMDISDFTNQTLFYIGIHILTYKDVTAISWIQDTLDKPDNCKIISTINKRTYLIDGRNWYYKSCQSTINDNNLDIKRIKTDMEAINKYDISVIFIFHSRHKKVLKNACPSIFDICIFTPFGKDDDIMSIYLWLSHPQTILLSKDRYTIYSHILKSMKDNSYYDEFWTRWNKTFKISDTRFTFGK